MNNYVIMILLIGLIDIVIPVPIIGLILVYVILNRPAWFKRMVDEVYRNP